MLAASSGTEGMGFGGSRADITFVTVGVSSTRSKIEKFYFGCGGLATYLAAGFGLTELTIFGAGGLNEAGGLAIGFIFDS